MKQTNKCCFLSFYFCHGQLLLFFCPIYYPRLSVKLPKVVRDPHVWMRFFSVCFSISIYRDIFPPVLLDGGSPKRKTQRVCQCALLINLVARFARHGRRYATPMANRRRTPTLSGTKDGRTPHVVDGDGPSSFPRGSEAVRRDHSREKTKPHHAAELSSLFGYVFPEGLARGHMRPRRVPNELGEWS